jgi:Uma2 family endonuclease
VEPGPVATRRWTRVEYARLLECGLVHEDDPIELIEGCLVVKEPQHAPHATACRLVARALDQAFAGDWDVRSGLPLALDTESEPEPDVSVVAGGPRDYLADHPARPVLVVEVSSSSLAFDRRHKASLYARAGIAEYWIVNLAERCLEVYRDPVPPAGPTDTWRYGGAAVLRAGEAVTPLAAPAAGIPVADLLP